MTTPQTAAGRAAHDWWHSVALPLVGAAPSHDHPFGCEFQRVIGDIEAEAAAPYLAALAALVAATEKANLNPTKENWRKADAALAAARRLVES